MRERAARDCEATDEKTNDDEALFDKCASIKGCVGEVDAMESDKRMESDNRADDTSQ